MPQIQHFRDSISLPSPSASPYHIFFLPGNPGLVEYYAKFLSLLHSTLNQAPSTTQFNIAGCSYAGFETEPLSTSEQNDEHKLYDITEQVTHSLARLQEHINSTNTTTDNKTKPKVILIGHSFGTFVIAELMKRLYTPSSTEEKQQNYEIIGNIHLFPPIPDLAKSPRGVKAAGVAKWKYLPSVMSYIAKAVYNLPLSWSNALVRYMTSFPSDALYTTRMFFGSKTGVAQALHLVKFEFDEIKLSRWEASFRSIASYQKQEAGQFPIRIFFGANDHWVDNELRDAFIYKYCDPSGPLAFGKEGLDLQARIDPSRDGDEQSVVIPHDFSIGHSEHVVPYVAEYVEEIIGSRT